MSAVPLPQLCARNRPCPELAVGRPPERRGVPPPRHGGAAGTCARPLDPLSAGGGDAHAGARRRGIRPRAAVGGGAEAATTGDAGVIRPVPPDRPRQRGERGRAPGSAAQAPRYGGAHRGAAGGRRAERVRSRGSLRPRARRALHARRGGAGSHPFQEPGCRTKWTGRLEKRHPPSPDPAAPSTPAVSHAAARLQPCGASRVERDETLGIATGYGLREETPRRAAAVPPAISRSRLSGPDPTAAGRRQGPSVRDFGATGEAAHARSSHPPAHRSRAGAGA